MRINPIGSGIGELPDIQFAGAEKDLAELAIDDVAVDISVREDIVLPERLKLSDGIVESAPIPEANVVEQRAIFFGIDRRFEACGEVHLFDSCFEAVSGSRGLNVALDVRLLKR